MCLWFRFSLLLDFEFQSSIQISPIYSNQNGNISTISSSFFVMFKLSFLILESKFFETSQMVKKRRSKIYRSSDNRKISSLKSISSNMASAETSCLSSSSSSISSAQSQRKTTKAEKMQVANQRKRRSGGSTHMRCRAEAILKLLSGGCFSEVNIRRVLGDSPDTSKALRMYSLSLSLFSSLLRVTWMSYKRAFFCKFIRRTENHCGWWLCTSHPSECGNFFKIRRFKMNQATLLISVYFIGIWLVK